MGKTFYKSKTMWFNAVMAGLMAFLPGIAAAPEVIAFVTALGNIILRSITDKPVKIK